MPSTVIFKTGYPSASRPVETQASIESSGMINGSATFIVDEQQANTHGWFHGKAIAKSLFNSLRGVQVQGLFVDSLDLEKRGGLFTLKVGVIGAVNPPIIQTNVDVSPRSISKTVTQPALGEIPAQTDTGSFDYLAETWSASVVLASNSKFLLTVPTPKVVSIFNRQGIIYTSGPNETNFFEEGTVTARERILTTETRQERNNIVTVTKNSQFIYE
jgi:hypothetical protein